jgi:GTP cyclohydrolase I
MIDKDKIETAVRMILEAVGEDPEREGLRDTPARVARMYGEILKGTGVDPTSIVRVFTEKEYDEMVLVKDIPLYSLCEHHMLPFVGKAHVAYIPQSGRVTGLSKLIRIVDMYARRLQVQERLTAQIADALSHNQPQTSPACLWLPAHPCGLEHNKIHTDSPGGRHVHKWQAGCSCA